jgi:hypothetical protein
VGHVKITPVSAVADPSRLTALGVSRVIVSRDQITGRVERYDDFFSPLSIQRTHPFAEQRLNVRVEGFAIKGREKVFGGALKDAGADFRRFDRADRDQIKAKAIRLPTLADGLFDKFNGSLCRCLITHLTGGKVELPVTNTMPDQGRDFSVEPPLIVSFPPSLERRRKRRKTNHAKKVSQVAAHVKEFSDFFQNSH